MYMTTHAFHCLGGGGTVHTLNRPQVPHITLLLLSLLLLLLPPSGDTFLLPATTPPRTLLEHLAKSIFDYHTTGTEYDPYRSGAEWWSMVLEEEDDVGE